VTTTYLDRILDAHRQSAALESRDLDVLIAETANLPSARGFGEALRAASPLAVISEVKRRSPSKGDLFVDLDPAVVARQYEAGGAACVSVLTDEEFFGGSVSDLAAVREAVDVPVLRKDFTVSAFDVVDARLMGADAILLIVAALDDRELREFHDLALSIGLEVLVEVHDEAEADRAVMIGASIIGINQRDLVTFAVDSQRALRVAHLLPDDVVRVAESGIGGPADIPELVTAGFDAVLVGESLVTSGAPEESVRKLIEAASLD